MHRTDFNNVSSLFALQNAVATTPRHAGDIQQLGTVNHVVVFTSRHADAFGLNLEAQAAFILPQSRSDSRLHAWRSNLARSVGNMLLELLASGWSRLPRSHCRQRQSLLNHSRAHRRCTRVARSHWRHCAGVLVGTIAVGRVGLRGGLQCLGLTIGILTDAGAWRRGWSVLHVSLWLIHAVVTLAVLVSGSCVGMLVVRGLLWGRRLKASRVVVLAGVDG